jgi:hypothetical protein
MLTEAVPSICVARDAKWEHSHDGPHLLDDEARILKIEKAIEKRLASNLVYLVCLALDPTAGNATSLAPPQLFGKSIVVSWSEARMQRTAGEQQFHSLNVVITESVYISTAGRPFVRQAYAHAGVKLDHVGAGGQSASGARSLQFEGRSIEMTTGRINGARRVEINLDESFESCTARVVNGKEAGASSYTVHSLKDSVTPVEVQSVSTSAATCSIKDGNVFADLTPAIGGQAVISANPADPDSPATGAFGGRPRSDPLNAQPERNLLL